MRLAIISDIHANHEALTAVLADIDQQRVDEIISLGDNIGYGPDPAAVVNKLQQRRILSIMGNHEWALASAGYRNQLNPTAKESLRITWNLMNDNIVDYCCKLPRFLVRHNCYCVHGAPPDSPTTYVFAPDAKQLARLFANFTEPLCFFGHTHLLHAYHDNGNARHIALKAGGFPLIRQHRYLINVGSVGQPRDENRDAKYLIWDSDAAAIEVRHIPYDIETTVTRILARGLPEINAKRLRP